MNLWLQALYESDIHELRLQWVSEDVDTVQAHQIGLQGRGYTVAYLVRPSVDWDGRVRASNTFYDDGNERLDLRAAVTRLLPNRQHWRVGGEISFSDTRLQSARYYTPEELIVERGVVAYSRRWDSGWELSGEAGIGWADEPLRGNRLVSNGAFEAIQVWSEYVRSRLGWDYSRSPGYQSWLLEGSVGLRF